MAPEMGRPFMESILVRFPPSMSGKTEAQTRKTTKSKSVAKQGHKLWSMVWKPSFLKRLLSDFHTQEGL